MDSKLEGRIPRQCVAKPDFIYLEPDVGCLEPNGDPDETFQSTLVIIAAVLTEEQSLVTIRINLSHCSHPLPTQSVRQKAISISNLVQLLQSL